MRMRIAVLVMLICAVLAVQPNLAHAQKVDLGVGLSTALAPPPLFTSGAFATPSFDGGAYPGVSADVLLHNIGVEGEVFWRASQGNNYVPAVYGPGVGYRPVLYNVNFIGTGRIAPHVQLESVIGVGAVSTKFYAAAGGAAPPSSNYFDGDFGMGIKIYPMKHIFIRPEGRFYLISSNTTYAGQYTSRVGVSVGYTVH